MIRLWNKKALRGALCAVLAWFVAGGTAAAAPSGVAPPQVIEFLGADAASVIASATRVEPFLLKTAMESPGAEGPDSIGGYFWQARGAELWPAQVEEFKDVLLDSASYDFDVIKKCVFVPEFAFRFFSHDGVVVVLVSVQCGVWALADANGEPPVVNFDPSIDSVRAIVETVFKLK